LDVVACLLFHGAHAQNDLPRVKTITSNGFIIILFLFVLGGLIWGRKRRRWGKVHGEECPEF